MSNLKKQNPFKTLVVEDDFHVRKTILNILNQAYEFELHEASNGLIAREIVEYNVRAHKASFDLILCDYSMPKLTGLDVFEFIHTHSYAPNCFFIMLVNEREVEATLSLFENVVDSFVIKVKNEKKFQKNLSDALNRFFQTKLNLI